MARPIVVTGGAGFIGSNIVHGLNARGDSEVVIVDRLGSGEKWKNLRGLRYLDVVDKDDFIAAVRARKFPRPRAVVHMGACSATTERDADYLLRNNFHYSRTLCEWSIETGARFVCASSAATYGDGALGYSDDDRLTPSLRPLNMYGYSKQMFDEWALRHGLFSSITALKFFNVYGPGEGHKGDMRSVPHKAFHQVKSSGEISLFCSARPDFADGEQKRDFVYVKDAVAVVLHFLDRPEFSGLVNCGTGIARTWLDLAAAVFAAMGRPEKIKWIDMPEALAAKYQYFTQADARKLRALGFAAPFTTLEEGVAQYVEWLKREE